MIVYLDKNYICHASDDGSMRPVETDFFDGKCPEFIDGYRWIPWGKSWTNEDGVTFHGDCMMLVKDYTIMCRFQSQHEADDSARFADLGIPQEQGMTATHRYPIGSFLSVYGEIYEVISIILTGSQIILGSNVRKSTVEEYINKKVEDSKI